MYKHTKHHHNVKVQIIKQAGHEEFQYMKTFQMGKNMKKRKDEIFIIQKPTIQLQKHSCTRLQLTAANIFEDSY